MYAMPKGSVTGEDNTERTLKSAPDREVSRHLGTMTRAQPLCVSNLTSPVQGDVHFKCANHEWA